MANKKLKVGDRFVFGRGMRNKDLAQVVDITIGRIYTIAGVNTSEEAWFLDDKREVNYAASKTGIGKATKIID